MAQAVLLQNGTIVPRRTLRPLTVSELPDVTLEDPIDAQDPVDAQGKDVFGMPLKDMSIETGVSLHQGEDTGVIKQYAAEVSSMKTNAKRSRITHKYGIEVPTSLDHAKRIDERNKNTLWSDAIQKEMDNIAVAFDILEPDDPTLVGWTSPVVILYSTSRWILPGRRDG